MAAVVREVPVSESDPALPRRAILKSAGLGVGAGLLSGLPIGAQPVGGSMIWSAEFWAKKGDALLYLYRKWLCAPITGEPPRPVPFLVHGSSVTWRIFDLDTPGHGEYSMMNVLARRGFDVWTMDHENYGKSGRTSGNSDIASGAQDLKAAMPVIVKETAPENVFHGRAIRSTARGTLRNDRTGARRPSGPGSIHLQRHRIADT
jgi:hypothetical protein